MRAVVAAGTTTFIPVGSISSDLKALGDSVRPGQPLASALTATRINAILGLLRTLAAGGNLLAGRGLLKQAVAEGAMLSVLSEGSTASATHPFKVLNASTPGTPKVKVTFGQVNSVTPTINDIELDADPKDPPLLTVVTGIVYLRVRLYKDGTIDKATIHCKDKVPEGETEAVQLGYLTLATVTVTKNSVTAINQAVTHSLGHQKCGVRHNFWGV